MSQYIACPVCHRVSVLVKTKHQSAACSACAARLFEQQTESNRPRTKFEEDVLDDSVEWNDGL